MKGLELARNYFTRYGLPLIHDKFPDYQERIAGGLVGMGSECLGFDDEFSRDHDWGPGFCLWLTQPDFEQIGRHLQEEYQKLPATHAGFERQQSEWGGGRVGVFETGEFYRGFIGRTDAPQTLYDWLRIPENSLSACTSGQVFYDPLQAFSAIRQQLLKFYPDDVRIVKIAARCMSAGQSGQYNFVRSLARRDYFAAQYAQTKFCSDIMSLVYLLNRRYAPYYKWLLRGIADLPVLGPFMFDKISAMAQSSDYEHKRLLMDEICAAVIGELQREGLSDSDNRFLVDQGPVMHDKIVDDNLRKMDVWIG